MREIKFRSWLKEQKGMIYGFVMDNPNVTETNKNILMQYTGLKDKNGVEIFEGDIVTSEHYPFQDEGDYNYHGIIEWGRTAFHVTKRCVNPKRRGISDGMSDFLADYEDGDFEVIGNIYENPELLEVQV